MIKIKAKWWYNTIAKGYVATTIYPFVFYHPDKVTSVVLNHERIHIEQQKELFLVGFYVLYIYYHFKVGYDNNPFELEAYKYEHNFTYYKTRKFKAWRNFLP